MSRRTRVCAVVHDQVLCVFALVYCVCMIKFWREKSMTIAGSVKAEIDFMAGIYSEGLPSLAQKLIECSGRWPQQQPFKRPNLSTHLIDFVNARNNAPRTDQLYEEIVAADEMILCIQTGPAQARPAPSAAAMPGVATAAPEPAERVRVQPDYDHDASDTRYEQVQDEFVLFEKPSGDDLAHSSLRTNADRLVLVSKELRDVTPQTVSARHLIRLDVGPWYGTLRVVPGTAPLTMHHPITKACMCKR